MVQINEWLPNPSGKDSENEWIELYNNSDQKINLNNWIIYSNSKTYKIKNKIINPHSFLILKRQETKLNLLNSDGELKIFNSDGKLIDEAKFFGQAPENKSFSRFNQKFIFTNPTPNQKNELTETAQIIKNYPENIPLNKISYYNFIFIGIIIGILLSLIFWYIIKNNDEFKNLFFK